MVLYTAGCTTPKLAQQKRVVYGERNKQELTYEFLKPKKNNGLGIVVMVSGSWRADPKDFKPKMGRAFLRRGYSIFAVSQAKDTMVLMDLIAPTSPLHGPKIQPTSA